MIDARSRKEGAGVENVIIGVACGRLVTAMATEKSSIAMLFDITDITPPELLQVFHLSPAAQNKSFGLAYNEGTLGEIDTDELRFIPASLSPSGKPGYMFFGEDSGTVSYWEFDCVEPDIPDEATVPSSASRAKPMAWSVLAGALASVGVRLLF